MRALANMPALLFIFFFFAPSSLLLRERFLGFTFIFIPIKQKMPMETYGVVIS